MMYLFLFCFFYYLIAGLAVVIGYHRCLTHRSIRLKQYFEYLIIFLGLPAGTPIQWVGNHRFHHIHSDRENDPHSPIVHGFWYAHNGWYLNISNRFLCLLYAIAGPFRLMIDGYLRPITNQEHNQLARDVSKVPFYRTVSKPIIYRLCMFLHLIIPYGIVLYQWSVIGGLALWICQIIIYNLGDSVNSLGHQEGHTEYGQHNKASNLTILSLLTFGDGLHANHHEFPNSAKLSLRNKGIDIGWLIIMLLQKLNLAYDIKTIDSKIVKLKSNDRQNTRCK